MIDTEEVRKKLLERREELQSRVGELQSDALDAGQTEVQDEIDRVISSEAQTSSLELSTLEFRSLQDVRDALVRLDHGTYGKCVICDRDIEPARLRAIPETPYCIADAEQIEKEERAREQSGFTA